MMVEVAIWSACIGSLMLLIALATIVWRLATRITNAEGAATEAGKRADTASIAVINHTLKIDDLAKELADHREEVAKEYVSYKHMTNLENRLVDAIGALGSMIDALFSRIPHG